MAVGRGVLVILGTANMARYAVAAVKFVVYAEWISYCCLDLEASSFSPSQKLLQA